MAADPSEVSDYMWVGQVRQTDSTLDLSRDRNSVEGLAVDFAAVGI
jgi:hypothetical protein